MFISCTVPYWPSSSKACRPEYIHTFTSYTPLRIFPLQVTPALTQPSLHSGDHHSHSQGFFIISCSSLDLNPPLCHEVVGGRRPCCVGFQLGHRVSRRLGAIHSIHSDFVCLQPPPGGDAMIMGR